MRKFLAAIRANDWWEYKFPPMVAIAYIIILDTPYTLFSLLPLLMACVGAVIVCAIYVSLLNDATDVAEDARAGKKNGMAAYHSAQRTILVLLPLIAGGCIIAVLGKPFFYASLFYAAAYIAFTLYSLPPFRFKKRGMAGIIADALGSQVFPTLFIAICFYQRTHQQIPVLSSAFLAIWLFCFGMRGILWHQLADKENDKTSGLVTIVQKINEVQLARLATGIVVVEITAFATYVLLNSLFSIIPGLLVYLVYNWLLQKCFQVEQVLVSPKNKGYRIFLFEYYQVFLPLSVLIVCVYKNPVNITGLLLHCLLFPSNMLKILGEVKKIVRITVAGIRHR
jgi:hypothetical protein